MFNKDNFKLVGGQSRNFIGGQIFSYATTDTFAVVSVSGYFNAVKREVSAGDLIFITASDDFGFVRVASGSLDITVSNYTAPISPVSAQPLDFLNVFTADATTTVAVNVAAGNLNGTYTYRFTYVTAVGETWPSSQTATVSPSNQQVDLSNIPIGPAGVTGRNIYRTTGSTSGFPNLTKFVATISDNTTTTYTDNLADGSLGVNTSYRNTTGGQFSVNGDVVMEIGANGTFIGYKSGEVLTGSWNTFYGYQSGKVTTTGYDNVFMGDNSGLANTTGFTNTFIGNVSGFSNTTEFGNTFIGNQAGKQATGGSRIVAVGESAGFNNTSGAENVWVGNEAGFNITSGSQNVALGHQTARFATSSFQNVFLGAQAGFNQTTANFNVLIGYRAGYSGTTGEKSIKIGHEAGYSQTSQGSSVFIGHQAGRAETAANKLYIHNNDSATPLIGGDFSARVLSIGGDLNPEADGTRDLGIQTTAQWANVWADLVNGADYAYLNNYRTLEAEKYEGYPEGIAIGHEGFEDGVVTEKMPAGMKPLFAVTEEFIEYKGVRFTAEKLEKLLELVS